MSANPRIILITGIMAAGKSTVAQALAERLPDSVHLRGDLFRRMIVNGRLEMTLDAPPAALAQLELRFRAAARAALEYLDAGFDVVYQDIIIGEMLGRVTALFPSTALRVVVLCPEATVVATREAGREKSGYGAISVAALDRVFRDETPRLGLWLDTSELTVDQTVTSILERLDEARLC